MAQTKKFSPMRYTAATEDAAVQGALLLVGATRDDIDYDVLDQTEKGVTVRIRPREEGSAPVAATPASTPAPSAAPIESAPVITPPPVEEVAVAAVLEDEADPADALTESADSVATDASEPSEVATAVPVPAATETEPRPRKSDRNGYNRP